MPIGKRIRNDPHGFHVDRYDAQALFAEGYPP